MNIDIGWLSKKFLNICLQQNGGLFYEKQDNEILIGYSDADFAGDIDTRRSIKGYIFNMSNIPVTWSSQRQKLYLVRNTTESEYVAATTVKEIIYASPIIKRFGL